MIEDYVSGKRPLPCYEVVRSTPKLTQKSTIPLINTYKSENDTYQNHQQLPELGLEASYSYLGGNGQYSPNKRSFDNTKPYNYGAINFNGYSSKAYDKSQAPSYYAPASQYEAPMHPPLPPPSPYETGWNQENHYPKRRKYDNNGQDDSNSSDGSQSFYRYERNNRGRGQR